jgi:peroxiredoxin (alkyl hydroperoxide reductase subunit C)
MRWMALTHGRMKDEHSEVLCPANWREGGKTIRSDPIAKLDYFGAVDGQHEISKANCTKRARVD